MAGLAAGVSNRWRRCPVGSTTAAALVPGFSDLKIERPAFDCAPGGQPVGPLVVVLVQRRTPLRVRHRGPMVLVEAGRVLDTLGVDVEPKTLLVGVQGQRAPREGVKDV